MMSKSNEEDMNAQVLAPSIHPAYARLLCAHLRNKEIKMGALFQGNSLNWQDLLQTQRFISFDQFRRLYLNAVKLTGCEWLGLEISSMIQVSAHGPMGYGAVAAPTVRDAFKLVQRMLKTRISMFDIHLIEAHGRALFTLENLFDLEEMNEFICLILFGSFLDMLNKTSGSSSSDVRVHFPFKEPSWAGLYHERFPGVDIGFGYERHTIDMPGELFDWHCLTADEFAYRNAIRECEQLLVTKEKGGELSEQIKHILLEQGAPYPTQQEMAERHHISVRTLIRKLKTEGESYQSLLDEVRKELACWYLQNSDMPIERVAEKLGFEDTSNFSRVFKRWMDCKPSDFRRA